MNKKNENFQPNEHLGFVKRVFRSIRTRYSIATAFFLLVLLSIFYIGGRIVLVHMMRDAESRVRTVWMDVSGLVKRNIEVSRKQVYEISKEKLPLIKKDDDVTNVLKIFSDPKISFIVECTDNDKFLFGAINVNGEVIKLDQDELSPYAMRFRVWRDSFTDKANGGQGIVNIRQRLYSVTLVSLEDNSRIFAVGTAFDLGVLSGQVTAAFSGVDVHVAGGKVISSASRSNQSSKAVSFGIEPMISEALSFYSGGFWEINARPLDASFAIRDIAGGAVATISLSVPQTLSGVAHTALGRLGFFVAMAGIILILPIFWFQGHMLLNPLTKMTKAILSLSKTTMDNNCPRLEWEGKDEFALLAVSVNRMLETIAARTIELAQLESRQRALINGVPDALVVFDSNGKLISIYKQAEGAESIPGFCLGETLSLDVYTEGEVALFQAQLSLVAFSGETTSLRLCAQNRETIEEQYFELRMTKMDEHFVLGIVRNVTEEATEHQLRLAAERRAMDTSKRESITMLSAGIAHDVNNVLSVILNTVESCSNNHECCQAVRDAVKRGSQMTRELMTVAGEARIRLSRVNPSLVVHDVQTLAAGVTGNNVELIYHLADGLPDVDVDPNQFWKVFFNIIKNAVEAFGSNPGRIIISTEECQMTTKLATEFLSDHPILVGKGVLFTITDDGPGIPTELLNKLFDPYVSSKALGRGLGLATVRAIIDAHNGGIQVVSASGRGTTFKIYLPETKLLPKEIVKKTLSLAEKEEVTNSLPKEILIIDNDDAILRTSSILLKALGVNAHLARNRTDALTILHRHANDIGAIILDVNLGGIDSVRLLETLKSSIPHARTIVTSGSNEDEVRERFKTTPFDKFLAKPWTVDELKATLS